jgi:hypothetical protein
MPLCLPPPPNASPRALRRTPFGVAAEHWRGGAPRRLLHGRAKANSPTCPICRQAAAASAVPAASAVCSVRAPRLHAGHGPGPRGRGRCCHHVSPALI